MEPDDKICYCFGVKKRKILNFIRLHQPRRASQISQCQGAGTGCGWCVSYLERLFEQAQNSGTLPQKPEPTPAQYAQEREAYLKAGKTRSAAGSEPPAEKRE